MTTATTHRRRIAAVVAVLGLAAVSFVGASTASADSHEHTVVFTGQGLMMEDDSYYIEEEMCDESDGMPYLLFVLTANKQESPPMITYMGDDGEMYQNGNGKGSWKYMVEDEMVPADLGELLDGAVTATYYTPVKGNVQLVLSHGCPGDLPPS